MRRGRFLILSWSLITVAVATIPMDPLSIYTGKTCTRFCDRVAKRGGTFGDKLIAIIVTVFKTHYSFSLSLKIEDNYVKFLLDTLAIFAQISA